MRPLAAVGLLLLAAPVLAQDPIDDLHGEAKLVALVKRVSEVQSKTTSLAADFEQRKVSRLLAEPSVSRGKFYFRAPDEVRWEYAAPRQMSVVLARGVALTYRPAEARAERVELGRMQKKFFRFLGAAEPLEQLGRYFSFTLRDRGTGNYILELNPTSHMLKKRLQKLTIEIDRTLFLPVSASYSEPDGDSTAYVFSNIQRNKPVPPELFNLELPPGVQVVEMKLHGSNE